MDEDVVAPKTWYVYTYAFPDGIVFYVGKGTRGRIEEHEREAQSGCDCEKCRIIRRIWKSGKPVQKRIVYETLKEREAFAYERSLINDVYGLENLTNRNSGVWYQGDWSAGIDEGSPRLTLKKWRVQAGLSIPDLARLSGVKYFTIGHMESGKPVSRRTAYKVLDALSRELGQRIAVEQVDQLRIEDRASMVE